MTDDLQPAQNGAAFAIGDLLSLIVPFEFPFEGQTLKGRWYKYKTSTRAYSKEVERRRLALIDQWGETKKEINTLEMDDPRVDDLIVRMKEIEIAAERNDTSWLTDALVEWNAIGADQQTIPLTAIGLLDVPVPFLTALAQHLIDSRTDKNPTSAGS